MLCKRNLRVQISETSIFCRSTKHPLPKDNLCLFHSESDLPIVPSTISSTAEAQNATSSSRTSTEWVGPNTNTLSTLVIVAIAISAVADAVIIGLAVSGYIWRKRRFLTFFSVFHIYLLYMGIGHSFFIKRAGHSSARCWRKASLSFHKSPQWLGKKLC